MLPLTVVVADVDTILHNAQPYGFIQSVVFRLLCSELAIYYVHRSKLKGVGVDKKALYNVGYGLYVCTAKAQGRDNGCIINTVLQVTSTPAITGVITVNKDNLTHDLIMDSQAYNVSILDVGTPFAVFEHFGLQSGKNVDKFAGYPGVERSANGLIVLPQYSNSFLSFAVTSTIDFGTHTMFVGDVVDGEVLRQTESMTYAYYQAHVKPRPQPKQEAPLVGWRCTVCNHLEEGEELPDDFVCPVCKHGADVFVREP